MHLKSPLVHPRKTRLQRLVPFKVPLKDLHQFSPKVLLLALLKVLLQFPPKVSLKVPLKVLFHAFLKDPFQVPFYICRNYFVASTSTTAVFWLYWFQTP